FFSSRRRHTRFSRDWSSDVCSSDLPFWRLDPAPFNGTELNPVLQDIGLAIHPPLLYLGYVGFSICFSFAVAALVSGRIDAAWARSEERRVGEEGRGRGARLQLTEPV